MAADRQGTKGSQAGFSIFKRHWEHCRKAARQEMN
jgi:hypothetical protein